MYSERKWIKQGVAPEAGWQETGRTMTNGNGQRLIEIGKPVPAKTTKKPSESTDTEVPAE